VKIVTIDEEPKSRPGRANPRPSDDSPVSSNPQGLPRFVKILFSAAGVLMLGWGISALTAEPAPSRPAAAQRVTANPSATPPDQSGGESSGDANGSTPAAYDDPPRVLSVEISPARPHLGDELEARAVAFDANGDPVEFSYTWVVNGENAASGADSKFSTAGLHKRDRVVVRVVPSDGMSSGVEASSQPVLITNRPPEITSVPSMKVAGGVYSYDVKAADPDGDPLQFRLTQSPEGMTIQPDTGVIQWRISTEHPSVDIGVVAADGDGAEAYQQFKLTVRK
jgi:Putative Ig domain